VSVDVIDAQKLYQAVVKTLEGSGMMGLLAAAGDANAKVPWEKTSPKTQALFLKLRANLTVAMTAGSLKL